MGDRLLAGLRRAGAGRRGVAAIGSDHPELTAEQVDAAFALLAQGADVVLGPALDGGYTLIAVRPAALHAELFAEISWSTAAVLDETLARCRALGLAVHLLPEGTDVDTPDDLARLTGRLAASPEPACPATRSLLARWGRLEPCRTALGDR